MSNTFEFAENSLANNIRAFRNSPFGEFWETAIHKKDVVFSDNESLKAQFRIHVSDNFAKVKEAFDSQIVDDNVIKLYLVVLDKKPIDYSHTSDLRTAGIRYSNIADFVGVVLGDEVYNAIKKDRGKQSQYVNKLADDFIEDDSMLEVLRAILNELFSYYMSHKRSRTIQLGLVAKLLQQELKKSLQEFWKPVLSSLASEIRKLKLEDEKYWQPYTPEGKLKPDNDYTPIVGEFVSDAQSYIVNFLNSFNTVDLVIQDYLSLDKIEDAKNLTTGTKSLLKSALSQVYQFFKDIFNFFKDSVIETIKAFADIAYTINAFLVGLYTSIVEFVASLIDLIGLMAGLLSGDAEQLWNVVMTEFDKIKEEGFFTYMYQQIKGFFDKVGKRYDSNQTKYIILKNFGEDLINIVLTILGAAASYKAGKALLNSAKNARKKFDELLEKANKKFNELTSVDPKGILISRIIKSIDELKDAIAKANIKNKYSNNSLEKILDHAKVLDLSDQDLLGFIKVGNIKDLSFSQLKRQMNNYVNIVLKRGYPFKFKGLGEFKRFSNDLLKELKKINIPIDDVRIQGSALRKRNAKDLDLGVFVDNDLFNNYLKSAFKDKVKLDGKIIDIESMSNDDLLKLADDIFQNTNTNASSRTFANAIKSGKISARTNKPRIMGRAYRDIIDTLNKKYPNLNIEDISVQKTGGKLELKPDLKIE